MRALPHVPHSRKDEDAMAAGESCQVLQQLRSAGKRITAERELLLGIIGRNPHLDASEIYVLAKAERPRIGLATVYRTLSLLEEFGVVRASDLGESHHHFEVHREDHVHLICSQCGRILDVAPPPSLLRMASAQGFQVDNTRLELFGLCSACATKRSPKSATAKKG
jgi:Fur family ferric uptake transcriptional regulator